MAGKLKECVALVTDLPIYAPRLPPEPAMVLTYEKIKEMFPVTPLPPQPFELEPIYKRFMEALSSDRWDGIFLRDWRYAPYLFWYGEGALIKEDAFRQRYAAWLRNQKATAFKRLIGAYLRDFAKHEEFPHLYRHVAGWIRQGLDRPDLANRLSAWKERHDATETFSDSFDTTKTADAFIGVCDSDMKKFLDYTGMGGALEHSGYMECVAKNMLARLRRESETRQAMEKSLLFFDDGEKWRFPSLRSSLLEALLLPWAEKTPDAAYKKRLQTLICERSGDPRLSHVRQKSWRGVSSEAIAVMMRWQVGETIEQFIAIIDKMALEEHWKYRRAFWLIYCTKGYIDDAWVAFARESRNYAIQSFGNKITAGSIVGCQDQKHSVLLLRIGDYIFADWSHNGKCRAWHKDDARCPKLYRSEYHADELRKVSLQIDPARKLDGIAHKGSQNYRWQNCLAEFIRKHTGLTMNQKDFHVV